MALIQVNKFSGVSPMTPPRYLGNEAAQTALNCPVWMGSLQPIRGALALTPSPLTKSGAIKSIYRFDQSQTNELNYWFHWTTDVDVVQGFIAGDTTERTYFTGDGNPKVTNATLSLTGGGNLYPIAAYDIGVPKPTGTFTTAKISTALTGSIDPTGEFLAADSALTGSINPAPFAGTDSALTGSIDPTASKEVVGVGTLFITELVVGDLILVSSQIREVATIIDATHLTVTAAFTNVANDTSPARASKEVVGVSTLFETELIVGDSILVSSETRIIETITDDTHLTVTVPFTDVANDTSPAKLSKTVLGVGTKFTTELSVGNSILVTGETRIIDTITDDTHLTVTEAFTNVANDTSPVRVPDVENTVAETRVYTFTHVNSFGEESTPYSETDMTPSTEDVYPGESVVVTLPTAAVTNVNVTKKRIYRSAAGTANTSFFFVAEVPLATTTYTDSLDGDDLNEVLPSLTWVQPPTTLKGLVGMPNGVMVGFSGNDVYFSEPFRPFAWPIQYIQTVGYPIVGLGVIDTTVVVLTQGRPYFIQGSHPGSSVMVEADINQACLSKRSIVSMGNAVFYASPDGLVGLSPGGSAVVTESMFDKYTWQAMGPAALLGCMYENKYVGFLDATSGNGGFVYDMKAKTWNFHNIYVTGAYNDLKNDALYLVQNNELSKWDSGTALSYIWKSKKFTFPEPKSFACYRVQAEGYPITTKIYRDGTEIVSLSVTDDSLRRLPAGLGTDWEFQLEGNKEVYNVQLAQSPQELNQG
jgi:hypothetical protein